LNTVTHKTAIPEMYIAVEISNQTNKCLLDTGCDHSIIQKKLVPTAILEPAPVDVTAANGSTINILDNMKIISVYVENLCKQTYWLPRMSTSS